MNTDINNIYGNIDNLSEVVLGIGNYNSVHGLLTSNDDKLMMEMLSSVVTPNIVECILEYTNNNLFSLAIKDTNKYVGVTIEDYNGRIAYACISDVKTYFSVNYSSIDKNPRSSIFSGVLYSLQTTIDNIQYTVSWKIDNLPNGDIILFLPLSWYNNDCTPVSGLVTLVESLKQLNFKGYTNEKWCSNVKHIVHCDDGEKCGVCLGYCDNTSQVCDVNENNTFICVSNGSETTTNSQSDYTWLAIVLVILIIFFLWWFFS